MCMDCPKLFPLAPKPSTSPLPGLKKRRVQPLTTERLLRERSERRKKTRDLMKRQLLKEGNGLRIRGRWIAESEFQYIMVFVLLFLPVNLVSVHSCRLRLASPRFELILLSPARA